MRSPRVPLLVVLAVAAACAALPAQSSDLIVVATRIDNVRNSASVFDGAAQCSSSEICSALATAISAYLQVPLDKVITVAAQFASKQDGEGTFTTLGLPEGYKYCRASMKMVSIVPHDGDRGSTFLARADETGVYYETWTPVLGQFEGRSWVEAFVTVVGVPDARADARYADGSCLKPGGRNLWYCRGGGCIDTVDTGQRIDSASKPGANSRND